MRGVKEVVRQMFQEVLRSRRLNDDEKIADDCGYI